MNQKMDFKLLSLTAAVTVMLAACGGGDGGSSDTTAKGSDSVVLSGQVVDSPIAGAQVCLFTDGVQARDAAGAAICSSDTDAQGNYTISIPRTLAPGIVTLVANKGSNIKLTSTLGTVAQVLDAAGNGGTVTPANLPAARVTHFTTADFALADANNDGTVSKSELDSYVPDFAAVQKVAAVIKAVIDFEGQAGSLIGGQTTNTLTLASAAARNQTLGSSNKTADEWLSIPENANIKAAVNQDLVTDLEGRFSNYKLTTVVTSTYTPPKVVRNDGAASIYCSVGTDGASDIQIAFDAARRIVVVKNQGVASVGSYNPQTGGVILNDGSPPEVVLASPSGITFYSEDSVNMSGTFNASSGNITGTFAEMTATTWTLDSTRQECTAEGTFTAIKL
jgi:filamentous hemagglutinin family protein